MALTVGTPTTSTSLSFSHTCASGTELLVVTYSITENNSGHSVTAATFNAVAMTQAREGSFAGYPGQVGVYYLVSPASGTHTLTLTYNGTADGIQIGAMDVSGGVNTVSPIGTTDANEPADPTASITTNANSGVVFDAWILNGTTSTIGGGQTQIYAGTGGGGRQKGSSYKAFSGGPVGVTMSWTSSGANDNAYVIVEVKAVVANTTDALMFGHFA